MVGEVYATKKSHRHNISEILLKLNTLALTHLAHKRQLVLAPSDQQLVVSGHGWLVVSGHGWLLVSGHGWLVVRTNYIPFPVCM